jgi:hypothetical protein
MIMGGQLEVAPPNRIFDSTGLINEIRTFVEVLVKLSFMLLLFCHEQVTGETPHPKVVMVVLRLLLHLFE